MIQRGLKSCTGPCLEHCYSKNNIIYLLIGLIIGIIISHCYYKNKKKGK